MCGIGLIWFRESVDKTLIHQMASSIEKRGTHSFGLYVQKRGGGGLSFKVLGPYTKSTLPTTVNDMALDVGSVVLMCARAKPMTEVASTSLSSIPPIIYRDEGLILAHNGCVANEDDLGFKPRTTLDSERWLYRYLNNGRNARDTMSQMVGGGAYLVIDNEREVIIAARDFKPLGKAYIRGVGYMIQSDYEEFGNLLGEMDINVWEDFYWSSFDPYSVNEIDLRSGMIRKRQFEPTFVSSLPPQDPTKVLVLSSGGIDSSVAACIAKFYLGRTPVLCHFDHGQKSEPGEQRAVRYLAEFLGCEHHTFPLQWLGALGSSVLTDPSRSVPQSEARSNLKNTVCWTPARNLVMCSALMAIAEASGASEIYNGWSLEEEGAYPDSRGHADGTRPMPLNFC